MTKVKLPRYLCMVFAVLALALPARAEEAEAGPSRAHAVLVGISSYADDQIIPRPHAEDDAIALYDVLTDRTRLGVADQNVTLLLGKKDAKRPSQLATRENILKALQTVVADAKPNDLVILAYFGEGAALSASGDRRCYFAADSTFKNREKDAIAAEEIQEALKGLKSRRFCAFLDVSFKSIKNPPKGTPEPSLGTSPYKEFLGDDGSEDHAAAPGRVIFLATNGLTVSLDLEKHGIFAEVILEGLKGAADKEGYEPDGFVTVDELTEYLDKGLPELARKHGKTMEQKQQLHFVLGTRGNHFALTKNPAVIAKVQERLEKFESLVKNGKIPARYAEEGRQLLERMPRLNAMRDLRKEYQKLVDATTTVAAFEASRDGILAKTKIARPDALEYARKVMEAIQVMKDNYVKEIKIGEMVGWAIQGLYRRIDEKIPEEIAAKLKGVKDLDESELLALLAEVRQRLGKREDLDDHKDIDITLQRMLSNLDPYTTYIDPTTLARFNQDVDATFTGIGIQIRKDAATDQLLVVTPIKGSPAYEAGLQAGDLITRVIREVDSNGTPLEPAEEFSTKGLALSDAVKKILGKPGTKVKVVVKREGVAEPFTVEITRGRVEVETVMGYQRNTENDDWDYFIDKTTKIGYVRLSSFARNTARDLYTVMEKMTEAGAKGFILDLRFNPGGLLDSAVKISDLFIDDGLIVSIRPRAGREAKFSGRHGGSLLDFPMVCLVNGFSASGSEIVSAALQDHGRAWVIGERSYGKGSVQNIQPFEGGALKLTTASFWRPSGKNLNKSSTAGKDEDEWGVTPDQIISLSRKEREDLAEAQRESEVILPRGKTPKKSDSDFKDRQLDAALEYLKSKIKTAARLDTPARGV